MSLLRKASIVTTPTSYENGKILSVKPVQSLSDELITNGDFATNSNWTLTQATISNGAATFTTTDGSFSGIRQNVFTIGKTYLISLEVYNLIGTAEVNTNAVASIGLDITSNGVKSFYMKAENTDIEIKRKFGQTNVSATIDNVSVKEVLDADFQFTRNSSATRTNSQGLIEDMQILSGDLVSNGDFSQEGSELVTNGDFSSDTDWTLGTGWSISGGAASCDGTQTSNSALVSATNLSLGSGNLFKITFNVSNYISGSLDVITLVGTGGPELSNVNANGSYTAYSFGASTGDGKIQFIADSNFIGSIDNVSVKEVGQDWTLDSGWSIGDSKATKVSGSAGGIEQANIFSNGKKYKLNFTVSDTTSGGIIIYSGQGSQNLGSVTSNGDKEFIFTSVGNQDKLLFEANSSFNGSITNIKIIEITDDTNLPRIDYTGGEGHWLFEPQSTNLETESAALTGGLWVVTGATSQIETSTTPFGVSGNVYKLTNATNNPPSWGSSNILKKQYAVSATDPASFYTFSVYVKSAGSTTINIQLRDNSRGSFVTTGLISLSSEWQRVTISMQLSTSTTAVGIVIAGTDGDILLAGAQFEQQSFATSYIPTNGSTVTRLADAAFGAGSSDLINSTEGVLYAEIAALANDLTFREISLSDGTTNNRVDLGFNSIYNNIQALVRTTNGANKNYSTNAYTITSFNKIAISYAENNFSFWINGVKIGGDTSGNTPIGLSELAFDDGNGNNPFFGKTKCVAVFKEALNNDELECLTGEGYETFNALALANNYTII